MAYIINIKDDNGEWEPIEAIKGADGEPGPIGPAGPQGEPGTTEWTGIDNKPFESIGEGLSVDSEGVLSAEGGLKIFEYKTQYTPEEVAEMGPGTAILNDNNLFYYDWKSSSVIQYTDLEFSALEGGARGYISKPMIRVNLTTGVSTIGNATEPTVPSFNSSKAGNILTVNSTGYEMEWTEPQSGTESIVIPYSSLPYTLTEEEQAKVKIGTFLIITKNTNISTSTQPEMFVCVGQENNNWIFKLIGAVTGQGLKLNVARKKVPMDTMIVPSSNNTLDLDLVNGYTSIDRSKGNYYWLPAYKVSGPNSGISATWTSIVDLLSNVGNLDTSTDGNYVLKATVSNGAVTYSWVPEV